MQNQIEYLRALINKNLTNKLNERGASAVEYGLLIAGIAVVIIAGILLLGPKINGLFSGTAGHISDNGTLTGTTTTGGTN